MILNSKEDVYKQIANNFIKLIENGIYEEGSYLPSVRDVAKENGINPNTVQKAYKLLEDLGYITIVNKKGAYVCFKTQIDVFANLKTEVERLKEENASLEEMIELSRVEKRFENFVVLNDINIKIEDKQVFGLVGINGAGKSTLLRTISGVYKPENGGVLVDGKPVFENEEAKKDIFFLSDEPYFDHNSTPKSIVKLYEAVYSVDEELYFKYLSDFKIDINKKLNKFSKGMKRQVFISLALAIHPKYLILDEAFDGLDPLSRMKFKQDIVDLMEDYGSTIIISSHSLRELEDICDTYALLNNNKISSSGNLIDKLGEMHKYQIAFKENLEQKDFPNIYKSFSKDGRIIKIITELPEEEVINKIKHLNPVIIDELTIDFEELFKALVQSEGYLR